jgi:hypothetical protein
MTDFVAILKKTIDGQAVNTAELRQRVYARARQTIEQKLASLTPAPTAEQKARQMRALDDAIEAVELAYAPAAAPEPVIEVKPADPLEAFISAAEAETKRPPVPVMPASPAASYSAPVTKPAPSVSAAAPKFQERPELLPRSNPVPAPPAARRGGGLAWASLGVLLAAGASYGAYVRRDEISAYYKQLTAPSAPEVKKVVTTSVKPSDPAAAPVKAEPATPAAPAKVPPGEEKFTQRLTEDGKEIESGPAAAPAGVGEGETVAQVTTPAAAKPAAAADPAAPAAPETPAAPVSVPVGQKAVFYEEKTGTEEGTVDTGAVVWSVVQDSPGADQPAEAAIRGEVNIPDKGVKLKLTIKRNGDKTLPASHIIEMAFTVSEGFQGGSIDGVQRVTFKDTEQAPGNPLVGVPANFGDGFFLIALTDEKSAVENNLALMGRQSWIDIPLTYKSGRRALISIEKGIPGDKVFQEVFKAWTAKAAG